MGFFSWRTADTGESIPVSDSEHPDHKPREAWLLQPGGEPAIHEPSYEGYGFFGGVHVYDWLALRNLPPHLLAPRAPGEPDPLPTLAANGFMTRILTDDELTTIGITLAVGDYCEDPRTGRRMTIFHDGPNLIDPTIEHLGIRWDDPVAGYEGAGANELVAQGRLVRRTFDVAVPLKFSFDPDARWEDLPASPDCEHQGFFYPDGDEEEDPCAECGEGYCDGSCADDGDGEFDSGDEPDDARTRTVH